MRRGPKSGPMLAHRLLRRNNLNPAPGHTDMQVTGTLALSALQKSMLKKRCKQWPNFELTSFQPVHFARLNFSNIMGLC